MSFSSLKLNLHPRLKYTAMIEENDQLPFLDILAVRTPVGYFPSVYRKPIFSELYLTFHCPSKIKLSETMIGTIVGKGCFTLCSTPPHFFASIKSSVIPVRKKKKFK